VQIALFEILLFASVVGHFGFNKFDFTFAAACGLNFTLCEAAYLQNLKFAALAFAAFNHFCKSKFQIDSRLSLYGDRNLLVLNF